MATKRNPYAKALTERKYARKVIANKKAYKRKPKHRKEFA